MHLPLLVRKRVEPSGEKRLDRRRHVLRVASVDEHCEQLFDEERVSGCHVADPGASVHGQLRAADELLDQLVGLGRRKRFERQRLGVGRPAPCRAEVDQVGAGKAEEEERCVASPVHQMLKEVKQRRLGPVDVLDDERHRPLASPSLECLPDRPEDVFRSGRREGRGKLVLGARFAEDLDQRPVRDSLAVGQAAAGEDGCLAVQQSGQLAGEPRLADPRRARTR